MAFYTSYGAAGEVTGSCHFLQINHLKILIDCGLFQGSEEEFNYNEFGFEPSEIDYLIITHAHLDHIGRIPLLVKEGFSGTILTTKATYSITKLMLANAAGILEKKPKPLYHTNDIEPVFKLEKKFLECNESITVDDIKITFKNAGHILGSVSVKLEFNEDGMDKSAVFSGDIGQSQRIITSPIEFWESANYIFVESTYGLSIHQDLDISIESFRKQILDTFKKGGTVVIPSFALERTQEILYLLRQMSLEGLLEDIPVFLDAPLAINVTKTFTNYPHLFNEEVKKILTRGENPFGFKELTTTATKEASQQINNVKGSKIIIAGSGMCEGGRVNYHLVRYLEDENSLALFVGYQVESTLGRKITAGNNKIKILGTDVNVKATIGYVAGFSAHADQQELLEWIDTIKDIYCVYLIHGDKPQLEMLKEKVKSDLNEKAHIVKMNERIYI